MTSIIGHKATTLNSHSSRSQTFTSSTIIIRHGTDKVGLKSYRHFFLVDCHTGMQCMKFGQLT